MSDKDKKTQQFKNCLSGAIAEIPYNQVIAASSQITTLVGQLSFLIVHLKIFLFETKQWSPSICKIRCYFKKIMLVLLSFSSRLFSNLFFFAGYFSFPWRDGLPHANSQILLSQRWSMGIRQILSCYVQPQDLRRKLFF